MNNKKVEVSARLLNEITADDARAVKRRLDEHCLSQKWLLRRLRLDYGIELSMSNLCDLFYGRWRISNNKHSNGQRVIFCAREILDRYESVF